MTSPTPQPTQARDQLRSVVSALRARTVSWRVVLAVAVLAAALSFAVVKLWGPEHFQYDLKIYYSAVSFWLNGGNIYDYTQPDPVNISLGFTYPPAAALFMAPMATLPLGVVVTVTVAGILLAGFFCIYLVVRALHPGSRPDAWQLSLAAALTVAAFAFEPMSQTVAFGQINLFLTLLVLLDALVLMPRRSRWAGIGVGLAMAIKLTPGIFLLYFIVNKRWREVVVALITTVVATALAALVAPTETWRYFTDLLWNSERVGFLDNTTNQSINGFLARALAPDEPSKLLWLALSAAVITVGVVRARRAVRAGDQLVALTLIGIVGLLVSPVSWIHHAIWVIIALILVGRWLIEESRRPAGAPDQARRMAGPVLLLASALFIWIVDTRVFFDLPDTHYGELGWAAVVESSTQVFWLFAAMFLLPIRRSVPALASAAGSAHPA